MISISVRLRAVMSREVTATPSGIGTIWWWIQRLSASSRISTSSSIGTPLVNTSR